ncbi:MAG: protein kinase [Pirellulaceae bacterium]
MHRDIKPSNVLVTAVGAAKVVDMGLARNTALNRSTADETASGVTLGTFDYISPEQARNLAMPMCAQRSIFLGCTLFYMLTGNPPFPRKGRRSQKLLSHESSTARSARLAKI